MNNEVISIVHVVGSEICLSSLGAFPRVFILRLIYLFNQFPLRGEDSGEGGAIGWPSDSAQQKVPVLESPNLIRGEILGVELHLGLERAAIGEDQDIESTLRPGSGRKIDSAIVGSEKGYGAKIWR
jgi:hypothetical protein